MFCKSEKKSIVNSRALKWPVEHHIKQIELFIKWARPILHNE